MTRTRSILMLLAACVAPWLLLVARADSEPATVAADTAASSAAKAVESPEDVIAHALQARVSVEFPETPLQDVMVQLEKDWKIPILVDHKGLADQGISSDLPLTLKVSGVSARSVLDLLLRPLQLDWMVRDEVVWIGPRDSLELETKVYDVADLVGRLGANGEQPVELDKLIEVISTTIEPESWDEMGGNGSIQPCEMLGVRALVVRQLRREHEAIATLLDDIRQCQKDARPASEP